MPPHLLAIFETEKYYQNEPKFNSAYSENNLAKIKDLTYVINLYGYKPKGTYWIVLYVNENNTVYFDSFRFEHIPEEIKKFIGNKGIITNIYRIQAHDLIMCKYFCIGFINFMLKGKTLLDYTNLFAPSDYKKNDKINLKHFQ